MTDKRTNLAASVAARLLNRAKQSGDDYQTLFTGWRGVEEHPEGDFYVRSGPGTVKLPNDSAKEFIRTRFPGHSKSFDA